MNSATHSADLLPDSESASAPSELAAVNCYVPSNLNGAPVVESGLSGGVGGVRPYYDAEGVTLFCAPCESVLPFLGVCDLLLTDPPYGIGYNTDATKGRGTSSKKWKAGGLKDYGSHEWDDAVPAWVLALALARAKKQVIFGGNYYDLPKCRKWLVWDKESNGNFADCELAWTNLDGTTRRKRHLWNGFARAGNEERYHPTQKPLAVMAWALDEAGECATVLDPWAGSGTTLLAAKLAGKRAIGIEREERYCEIIVRRLAQGALFCGGEGLEREGEPTPGEEPREGHNEKLRCGR